MARCAGVHWVRPPLGPRSVTRRSFSLTLHDPWNKQCSMHDLSTGHWILHMTHQVSSEQCLHWFKMKIKNKERIPFHVPLHMLHQVGTCSCNMHSGDTRRIYMLSTYSSCIQIMFMPPQTTIHWKKSSLLVWLLRLIIAHLPHQDHQFPIWQWKCIWQHIYNSGTRQQLPNMKRTI